MWRSHPFSYLRSAQVARWLLSQVCFPLCILPTQVYTLRTLSTVYSQATAYRTVTSLSLCGWSQNCDWLDYIPISFRLVQISSRVSIIVSLFLVQFDRLIGTCRETNHQITNPVWLQTFQRPPYWIQTTTGAISWTHFQLSDALLPSSGECLHYQITMTDQIYRLDIFLKRKPPQSQLPVSKSRGADSRPIKFRRGGIQEVGGGDNAVAFSAALWMKPCLQA